MVIEWKQDRADDKVNGEPRIRAAEYVRMSTEHQQYSTQNQSAAIRRYASERGFKVVRSYADEGKSGLNIGGRKALQSLLEDIEGGTADFEAVLVYDVSRWGRFQDPDEAASYELRCRRLGVAVHYCAEQFENDGSIGSSIIKTVKRAMAGEYSRELSVKVYEGQANLIRQGFRQGGPAGFGLRRLLVDENGDPKTQLAQGEQKSIATDRVILVPGPDDEVAVVNEIYTRFVVHGHRESDIAASLNTRGIKTDLDRLWTRGSIHQLLINEKYIGNNVWGRTAFKLKQARVQNAPDQWVRADGVFASIVDRAIFDQAQSIIVARSERLSDQQMLDALGTILSDQGKLSGLIIDEFEDSPSSSTYRARFGSLLRAYSLVGFVPDHDYRYVEINRQLRKMHPDIMNTVVEGIHQAGGWVDRDDDTGILTVNDEFFLSVVIARCSQTPAGSLRWKLRLEDAVEPSLTVAVRMNVENSEPRDYYILPRFEMRDAFLRLCEWNGLSLDAYRFDSLDFLYGMAARQRFRRAA